MRKNKYTSPIIILTLSIIVYLAADMLSSFRGRSSINYKLLPLNTTITWGGYNLYSFVPIEVEDRCKFYEEGLPISVYNPDNKLDTIHFKTIVEYGVRKDRLIFHAKDIDDTDILKVSNTSGYMTVEHIMIDKPLVDQEDFNKLIKKILLIQGMLLK